MPNTGKMQVLKKEDYHKALGPLKNVGINHFFARSVVEQCVSGKVYVDDVDDPKTFYVVHPYGMSLLFGEAGNTAFNNSFREYALNTARLRDQYEWMQAFPSTWDLTLQQLFKDRLVPVKDNTGNRKDIVELNTRVNFKFDPAKYKTARISHLPGGIQIRRTDKDTFRNMKGSVVPAYFWESEDHFLEKGVGYSLFYGDKLTSTAYASFIHDDKLELGIETIEEFRGKGFAWHACAALIDHCIETNFEPVWACRLENMGSYKLALKLGFEPSAEIPYYRLSN